MDISQKIIACVGEQKTATTASIIAYVGSAERTVYKYLNRLTADGTLIKVGQRPYVTYSLAQKPSISTSCPSLLGQKEAPKTAPKTSVEPSKAGFSLLLRGFVMIGLVSSAFLIGFYSNNHPKNTQTATGSEVASLAKQEKAQLTQELEAEQAKNTLLEAKIEALNTQIATGSEQLTSKISRLTADLANQDRAILKKNAELVSLRQALKLKDAQLAQAPLLPISPKGPHISITQIVQWTKKGVPSQEILTQIKTTNSTYSLTPDDLNYLRKQGVSEEVFGAMR